MLQGVWKTCKNAILCKNAMFHTRHKKQNKLGLFLSLSIYFCLNCCFWISLWWMTLIFFLSRYCLKMLWCTKEPSPPSRCPLKILHCLLSPRSETGHLSWTSEWVGALLPFTSSCFLTPQSLGLGLLCRTLKFKLKLNCSHVTHHLVVYFFL